MDNKDQLVIPSHLWKALQLCKSPDEVHKVIQEILKDEMFQMLNDYPIPHQYCLHLRQIVYPDKNKTNLDGTIYKSYQCINCKKYL